MNVKSAGVYLRLMVQQEVSKNLHVLGAVPTFNAT